MQSINYAIAEVGALPIAFGMWLAMLVIAVTNGYIGNTYVTPRLGDYGTHVYKTLFFVLKTSWEVLLADYRIWQGRLWSLVLISEAIPAESFANAPVIMGWLINRF
jgi:hypothetical protein